MASEPDVAGRRILVVEDDYLIASDLAAWLEDRGVEVLGPAPSVADALALLDLGPMPDSAVLDINLGAERVFPVANALLAANVPFVFMSGYDAKLIPEQYNDVPLCPKPLERMRLLRAIAGVLHR